MSHYCPDITEVPVITHNRTYIQPETLLQFMYLPLHTLVWGAMKTDLKECSFDQNTFPY